MTPENVRSDANVKKLIVTGAIIVGAGLLIAAVAKEVIDSRSEMIDLDVAQKLKENEAAYKTEFEERYTDLFKN